MAVLVKALLLVIVAARHCLPSRLETVGEGPIRWAVKMTSESDARVVAREQGLSFVGRVDPFPDVFELELPRRAMKTGGEDGWSAKRDVQSVDEALSGHPAVGWASKQVALRRTKREFYDPAFVRQWHLVCIFFS